MEPGTDAPQQLPGRMTTQDVRTALLHLTELAAAYEGRGMGGPVREGDRPEVMEHLGWTVQGEESFDGDLKCLEEVVHKLLRHRGKQREQQRNALLQGLSLIFWAVYRAHQAEDRTALNLQERVQAIAQAFRVAVTDGDLDELVMSQEEIRDNRGASESAIIGLNKVVKLSLGRIGLFKGAANPLNAARRCFGRFVPRNVRARFAEEIHEDAGRVTKDVVCSFADLKEFDERTGLVQDRRVEGLFAEVFGDWELLLEVVDPGRKEKLLAILDGERTALMADVMDAIESDRIGVLDGNLPELVRRAARDYLARGAADPADMEDIVRSRGELERAVSDHVRTSVLAGLRAEMVKDLGALDTSPPCLRPLVDSVNDDAER